jgi:hypothetical protein
MAKSRPVLVGWEDLRPIFVQFSVTLVILTFLESGRDRVLRSAEPQRDVIKRLPQQNPTDPVMRSSHCRTFMNAGIEVIFSGPGAILTEQGKGQIMKNNLSEILSRLE